MRRVNRIQVSARPGLESVELGSIRVVGRSHERLRALEAFDCARAAKYRTYTRLCAARRPRLAFQPRIFSEFPKLVSARVVLRQREEDPSSREFDRSLPPLSILFHNRIQQEMSS